MANGVNPWLASAYGNTANPNQNYQSYLENLGIDVDPSKVGKFFGGITKEYGEDVGMARAGFSQGMQGAQMQGQQAAMQLGGGQGLASIGGGGFGRQSYGMQQGLQGIGQQYGQGLQAGLLGYTGDLQSAQRRMESQFRDVAGGLFARDAEGISYSDDETLASNMPPSSLTDIGVNTPSTGAVPGTGYPDENGNTWYWSEGQGWYTVDQSGSTQGIYQTLCFTGDTRIITIDGSKAIELINKDDIVKTFDLKNNELKESIVTKTFKHKNPDGYIVINNILKTTPNHPFYSNGEWKEAGKLVIGDKILYMDGVEHKVKSIDAVDKSLDVYNIEVDDTHNYFAEGYLVHNK